MGGGREARSFGSHDKSMNREVAVVVWKWGEVPSNISDRPWPAWPVKWQSVARGVGRESLGVPQPEFAARFSGAENILWEAWGRLGSAALYCQNMNFGQIEFGRGGPQIYRAFLVFISFALFSDGAVSPRRKSEF